VEIIALVFERKEFFVVADFLSHSEVQFSTEFTVVGVSQFLPLPYIPEDINNGFDRSDTAATVGPRSTGEATKFLIFFTPHYFSPLILSAITFGGNRTRRTMATQAFSRFRRTVRCM
jgi:hypothetical protein